MEQFLGFEASAGSGKTFNLVVRYLSLLFSGVKSERIVALTFTNKAANEMLDRVLLALMELEKHDEIDAVAKELGLSKEELLSKSESVLKHFLHSSPKIMTIDKFFTQILRRFSLNAGVSANFSMSANIDEKRVFEIFLRRVHSKRKDNVLIELSLLAQKRFSSIFELLGEMLLKSRELKERPMVNKSSEIFKHKQSAYSYMDELAKLIESCEVASQTAKKAVLYTDIDDIASKSWLSRETLNYRTFSRCFSEEMDQKLSLIKESLKEYMRAKEGYIIGGLFELLSIYEEVRFELARKSESLSFDDMSLRVYSLLNDEINSDFLYFRLDDQIEHLLLDEFQDTSILQYKTLLPIIEEIFAGDGSRKGRTFFYVGDVKQSIYRFRGGVQRLFYAIAKEYPQVTLKPMEINYRSSPQIVSFTNRLFAPIIDGFIPAKAAKDELDGYVEVVVSDEILIDVKNQCIELLGMGVDSQSISILTFTNGDGGAVEEILREANIKVQTQTNSLLVHQKEIRAIIEFFKYIYFKEEIYWFGFLKLADLKDSTSLPQESRFSLNNSLIILARNIVETYGISDSVQNIVRFIDTLEKFKDLESFIYSYEQIDAKAASIASGGIKILTVHSSKGLEFDNVIVLDRLTKKPPSTDPFILSYRDIELQGLHLRMRNRELIDEEYANIKADDKILENLDMLNLLYVALTRAKRGLYIYKKVEQSVFEPLALTPVSIGKKLYVPMQKTEELHVTPFEYSDMHYGKQIDFLRVNESEEESEEEIDYSAIEFGIALHYTLEMMSSFTLDALAEALIATLNRFGTRLKDGALNSIELRIQTLIKNSIFKSLVDGELYREQPFISNGHMRVMDLLVEHRDRWVIIDYKSSKYSHESHVVQLLSYKKIVSKLFSEEVEAYICYLFEENTYVYTV